MAGRIGRSQGRFSVLLETYALLQSFEITCEPLWHYTSDKVAADSMKAGTLWLTRGDSFLDDQEIRYGLDHLRSAFAKKSRFSKELNNILGSIEVRLKTCYVFSTTCDVGNNFVAQNYAGNSGFRVGFNANLVELIRQGWECENNPKYANDRYEGFEGGVVYEPNRHQDIANIAADAAVEFLSTYDPSDQFASVKYSHLIDALITCVILFKRPGFSDEKEYRVCLVRRPEAQNFERRRTHRGKDIHYVDIYSPLVKEIAELEIL